MWGPRPLLPGLHPMPPVNLGASAGAWATSTPLLYSSGKLWSSDNPQLDEGVPDAVFPML